MIIDGQLICAFCQRLISIRLVPLNGGQVAFLSGHEYCPNPKCELNQKRQHYAPRGKIIPVAKMRGIWQIPEHNSPALHNNFADD